PINSPTLTVRVYQLWIDHFRDTASAKEWKVVVGANIDYGGIASSDCINWKWEMPDGLIRQWHPAGAMNKTGTLTIPYSDQSFFGAISGDNFGDAYGTVE